MTRYVIVCGTHFSLGTNDSSCEPTACSQFYCCCKLTANRPDARWPRASKCRSGPSTRDMEALSAAGVPVFALRGVRGGWRLDDQWRTNVPGLSEPELRALLMAQPRVIGDHGLAAAAERAMDKLMAALPVSLRAQAAAIRQRLYVDTSGWWGQPRTSTPCLSSRMPSRAIGSWRSIIAAPTVRLPNARSTLSGWWRRAPSGTSWRHPAGLRTYRVSRSRKRHCSSCPARGR